MKNSILRHGSYLSALILLGLFGSSCKKDPVKKNEELNPRELYIALAGTSDGTKTAILNVLAAPDIYIQDTFRLLQIRSAVASDSDIVARIVLDTALVHRYNNDFNTAYKAVPPDLISVADTVLTIKAGQTVSAPFPVYIKDIERLVAAGATAFLAPYRIREITTPRSARVTLSNETYAVFRLTGNLSLSLVSGLTNSGQAAMRFLEAPDLVRHVVPPITINAVLSQAVPVVRTIALKQDNSLVADYNRSNNTSLPAFPEGYAIINNGNPLTIAPGSTSLPVSVAIDPAAMPLLTADKYVLPFRLEEPSSAYINASGRIVYVIISKESNNIDAFNAGLEGTVAGRASWSATASTYHDAGYQVFTPVSAIGKGTDNAVSGWLSSPTSGSSWFQVDMGSAASVKGFKLVPQSFFGLRYNIAQMTVQSSIDGTNWIGQGTFRGTASIASLSAKQPQQVHFFVPVTARYFRFNISQNYSRYEGVDAGFLQNAVGIADITAIE